jgi:hypothetical protein
MNPRRTSVVVVALASALMPTVADAKTFEGETELGKYAEVATAPTGIPKRVFIQWKTPCNRDDLTFVGATRFGRPLDEASADRVSDERVYEQTNGGLDFKYRVEVTAERKNQRRWVGTFSGKVRVFEGDEPLTTCVQEELAWYAKSKERRRGS